MSSNTQLKYVSADSVKYRYIKLRKSYNFTGDCVASLDGHEQGVVAVGAVGETNLLYTASFDGFTKVWDGRTFR